MRRIRTSVLLALGTVCATAVLLGTGCSSEGGGERSRSTPERPNVLIVLIDALRRDHLGTYGYPLPTSPAIDAFAAESVVFERGYSHSTWTKPSVATLFTSLYPDQHGLGRVGFEDDAGFQTDVLPGSLTTLAEHFDASGYRTGAIGTNVHIQEKTGFAQGFDHFFNKRLVTAFEVNDLLRQWLESGDDAEPFFAYAHYMDVHFPYKQRLETETGRFGNISTRPTAPTHWTRLAEWAKKHLTPKNLAALVARYDEEVAYVDQAFGELMAWLEQTGRAEDTIVFLISDHGEGFNEHGELQHGYAPFEEVTGIPFMIRLPSGFGIEPARTPLLAGLSDLMPTALELAGLEAAQDLQGRSLVPILRGERSRERPVYVEGPGVRGLRGPTHTLFVPQDGETQCFDNAADPMEQSPLAEPLPEMCGRLAAALEAMVARFALVTEGDGGTVTFDTDEVEELRALGYLD